MLNQILGIEEGEVTYQRLLKVLKVEVVGSLFESEQLDYKSKYHDDTQELAKDVTAFANRRGGVIVFGVKDVDEAFGRLALVELGDKATVLNQRLNQATQPLLSGVEWIPVECPEDEGKGLLLLVVPPSHLAPHAVFAKGKHRLDFYWRQGREVRLMQEGDIERAYRSRLQAKDDSREALTRAREWVSRDGGALYALAVPMHSPGRVYGSPKEAVDMLYNLQRSHVVKLSESVLGQDVRSRIGRVVATRYDDNGESQELNDVAVIDSRGVAAVRIDAGDINWLVQTSGYRNFEPERMHPELSSYTCDKRLLNGITMLLVGLRELYSTFGVSGGMLLEVGALAGGATMFKAPFASTLHGQKLLLEEDAAFDFELKVSDLHNPATLGRLISDVHQDVLAGFNVHHPPAADENGALAVGRLTFEGCKPQPSMWASKGVSVR